MMELRVGESPLRDTRLPPEVLEDLKVLLTCILVHDSAMRMNEEFMMKDLQKETARRIEDEIAEVLTNDNPTTRD